MRSVPHASVAVSSTGNLGVRNLDVSLRIETP